ncbi:hypothetical protein HY621_00580 [Candidatus Uhrbacteria bacterium]|nr:hypothetical protein [Candidatus Uhrbacteria bacterium]
MKFYKILESIVFSIPLLFISNSVYATQDIVSKDCGMRIPRMNIESDTITLRKIDGILVDSFFPSNERMKRLSKVCEFALGEETKYNKEAHVTVFFEYEKTDFRPRVSTWDQMKKLWIPYPSTMNRKTETVSADLPFKKQYIAVFADESLEYMGLASWYRHSRYPMGSATNIFPIGTKLKVTNRDTGKDTMVTVTSTWTNKDKRRVIDLVRTAFEKIANPREGLIRVLIERISES